MLDLPKTDNLIIIVYGLANEINKINKFYFFLYN